MTVRANETFEIEFDNDNPIVRDHRVYGVHIVPGVTLIDVVYRLGAHVVGHDRFELVNVLFKVPIATTREFARRIHASFTPLQQGEWRVEISSVRVSSAGGVSDRVDENAECLLRCTDEEPRAARGFDCAAFIRTAERRWSVDEIYRGVREVGVVHGPFMQTLGDVYQRGDEELMRLSLGDEAEALREMFHAHPAFLDGATFAGSSYKLAGGSAADYRDVRPYIPFAIRRVRLHRPFSSQIFVYSRHADKLDVKRGAAPREVTASDLTIYGEDGAVLAELERLSYKRVRQEIDVEKLIATEPVAAGAEAEPAGEAGDDAKLFASSVARFVEEQLVGLKGPGTPPLDPDALFFDAGLDSTHLLRLVRALEKRCGHDLYPTLLFEYQTLNALIGYLYEHERAHFAPSRALVARPSGAGAPADPIVARGAGAARVNGVARSAPVEVTGAGRPGAALGDARRAARDIAVVGLAGRYPGASTLEDFWDVVVEGRICTRELPSEHWGRFAGPDAAPARAAGAPSPPCFGGVLDDVDAFDSLFFQVTPVEADALDPQLRLVLETAWHAMEDAGVTVDSLQRSRTGVYVGVMNDDYTWIAAERLARTGEYASAGSYAHELANRISYHLNLRGPSMTVEAACASSMVALHLARVALAHGECDAAFAGGVNLSLHRSKYLLLAGLGVMSPDGSEKTFDAAANGYVPGEGVGVALLKPLERAVADGDRIYGVITGSAVNHSGRGGGRYSPNLNALTDVIGRGLADAGVDAEALTYVEAHGTGSPVGDPIEVQALAKALGRTDAAAPRCALGSKANLGHLESASGICSLTKVLLAIRHGRIPPCANVQTIHPGLRLESTPFVIPREPVGWPAPEGRRVAGIHSFGIGGTNAFMVVRGHDAGADARAAAESAPRSEIVPLSAKTKSALERYCADLLAHLERGGDEHSAALADLAYTLQTGRTAMQHRVAFVAASAAELRDALRDLCAGRGAHEGVFSGSAGPGAVAAVAPRAEDVGSARALGRIAEAWVRGADVDWTRLQEGRARRRVAAPMYPFERSRHAITTSGEARELTAPRAAVVHGTAAWREKAAASVAPERAESAAHGSSVLLLAGGLSDEVVAAVERSIPLASRERLPRSEGGSLAESATRAFLHALGIVKDALARRAPEVRQLAVIVDERAPEVVYAPLSALLKSARRESRDLRVKVITIASALDPSRAARAVRDELASSDDDVDVRYTSEGRREVRVHEVVEPGAVEGTVFRPGGVYWITGGLGGLGRLFARYIASVEGTTVILSGRTAPSEAQRRELEALGAPASRVELVPCDVSARDDVERAARAIEERFGPLTGVLHCAGVTRDALLLHKTVRQAEEVLAAKVLGAEAIDEATRRSPLEFVAFFSSVAAIWGNVGQADYAAANGFLDAYAALRDARVARGERRGKTVSIAWPLWRDGGMRIDARGELVLKEKTGMIPLSRGDGLQAFEQAIRGAESQRIVCAIDGGRQIFAPRPAVRAENASAPAAVRAAPDRGPAEATRAGAEPLRRHAVRYLSDALSRVFRLPPERLDPRAPLDAFGIDSANVLALTAALEVDLGPLPKTLFYEYRTLDALAEYLVAEHGASLERALRVPGAAASAGAPPSAREPAAGDAGAAASARSAPPPVRAAAERRGGSGPLDIAIIGMSGRFPRARSVDEFWDNLRAGRDCITEVPASRWDADRYYDPDTSAAGKVHCKWGGFIDGVDEFDPLFFKISPLEAGMMDPQERLFLQAAWETLEDGGYTRAALGAGRAESLRPEERVGVYVGVMYSEYQLYGFEVEEDRRIFGVAGNIAGVANRVSYVLDLHGPSIALDTMCSSSLTAIHLACRALRSGECGLALAGGVNVSIHPNKYAVLSQARIISTRGRCESFGKGGEGYVPGEGVGCVLLKPLERARADRDHIYGVIKGSALSHGGKASGYTVPSPVAQASTIALAIREAGVDPREISYIEAHGTGTSLGDPIEIAGLVRAFGRASDDKQYCAIGSAKSNIGHCESAAGIAGVCKVLLQMKHRTLAPSLHAAELNPYIDFASTPFVVQRELAPWRAPTIHGEPRPRVAGVSSFGAGGANAHVIIEEWTEDDAPLADARSARGAAVIVPMSARTEERLHAVVGAMLDVIARAAAGEGSAIELADVAFTLQTGREPMPYRVAFVAADLGGLAAEMRRFLSREQGGYRAGHASEDGLDLLADEDVKGAVVAKWIGAGRLDKLAAFWAKGLDLDWDLLSGSGAPRGRRPRRISLPTYSFERKRCGLPVQRPARRAASREVAGGLLQRMLPAASLGEAPRVVFESEIEASDPLVAHHRVQGRRVLPGVAMIEMAMEAAQRVHAERRAVLKDVVWMKPVDVPDGGRTLLAQLEPHGGQLRFEIRAVVEGAQQVHAQGLVAFDEVDTDTPAIDVQALMRTLTPRWGDDAGHDGFYEKHRANGVDYGPYFRGLRRLWGSTSESLGLVEPPREARDDPRRYAWTPCVADAALQSVAGIAASDVAPQGDGEVYLPYSIGRVELLGPIEGRAFVHARRLAPGRFDIVVVDGAGAPLAALRDFVVRPVKAAPPRQLTYVGRWRRRGLAPAAPAREGARALIIHRQNGFRLEDALSELAPGSVNVCLGDRTERTGEQGWIIDVRDPGAIARVLRDVGRVGRVYFLAALLGDRDYRLDTAYVEEEQERTVIPWLRTIKALIEQGYDQASLDVTVLTQDGESLPLQAELNAGGGALPGLTQSLAREYPHWSVRHVDIGKADMSGPGAARQIAELLQREAAGSPLPVAYRAGARYEREIAPLVLPRDERPAFTEGGVYVIAGGAGGLGRVMTEHLVRRYGAHVVWWGRRPMDEAIRDQLSRLADGPGTVAYATVDLTSLSDVARARDVIKEKHGRIHGVIHSAIVLRDRSLREMDEPRFREALDPKVKGSAVLGEAFGREDLDWICFYSSMQSVYAGAGQSNYAAGCTFKDAYARALSMACSFPVHTIDWGYWGTVGVVANEAYRSRMASLGIGSLEPRDGIRVQEAVIAHRVSHVLAVDLAPATRDALGIRPDGEELYAATQPSCFERVQAAVGAGRALRDVDAAQLRELDAADACLNEYVVDRLRAVMGAAGVGDPRAEAAPVEALAARAAVVDKQRPLFEEIVRIMRSDAPSPGAPRRAEDVTSRYPELAPHVALADACLGSLPQVLRGEVLATEVLFPGSSTSLVEGIYKKNAYADFLNGLVADAVEAAVTARSEAPSGPAKVRILEIGAGTGGTSQGIFERLAAHRDRVEYVYTDVSRSFLGLAQAKYSEIAPYMRVRPFDVERAPVEQGIEEGGFDVVVAANVLHATKVIASTLRNVKRCMKRNGLLVLNEIGGKRPFTTLTFGLLDGWWAAEDREVRLEGSPALSRDQWTRCLAEEGFGRAWASAPASPAAQEFVILAESDGRVRRADPGPRAAPAAPARPPTRASGARKARDTQGDLPAYVEAQVRRAVGDVLKLSDDDLDPGLALSDLGVDSIVAVDLVRRINASLGLSLKTTVIFDFPNIRRLAAHLCAEHPDDLARRQAGTQANGGAVLERRAVEALAEELALGRISLDQTLDRLRA
ncbi:polyketide synthase [Sorangium cellulosum So ce56]|uniref:Polyketide synthase n=1 Tax=Sorangium cellulosum (strain So ce56) TaxID=448385 RepID=A9GJ40_SORC5|nr:SDR family NAD(P)-dependent oxidoreductase [Sorangium cellulosum]CAN93351.1 polyketide synthase [Sorangium cellulosum So ce56]